MSFPCAAEPLAGMLLQGALAAVSVGDAGCHLLRRLDLVLVSGDSGLQSELGRIPSSATLWKSFEEIGTSWRRINGGYLDFPVCKNMPGDCRMEQSSDHPYLSIQS